MTLLGLVGVLLMILVIASAVWKGIERLANKYNCDHEYFVIEQGEDYIVARCFKCNDKIKIKWKYGRR